MKLITDEQELIRIGRRIQDLRLTHFPTESDWAVVRELADGLGITSSLRNKTYAQKQQSIHQIYVNSVRWRICQSLKPGDRVDAIVPGAEWHGKIVDFTENYFVTVKLDAGKSVVISPCNCREGLWQEYNRLMRIAFPVVHVDEVD